MIFVIGLWTFLRALLLEPAAVALENLALRHQLLVVPSTYSIDRVNIELPTGLIHDGRHADPHAQRLPPRAQNPPLAGARDPRVASAACRPSALLATSTPANRRPAVLGPPVPAVERLGC